MIVRINLESLYNDYLLVNSSSISNCADVSCYIKSDKVPITISKSPRADFLFSFSLNTI